MDVTPRIDIQIGALVLHGFPPGQRHSIADAFQTELTRLLAEDGIPPTLAGSSRPVDGGSYIARPQDSSASIGAGMARCVYRGLSR